MISSTTAAGEKDVVPEKQRCKHCGTIVEATRDARRAHRTVCELAPQRTRAEDTTKNDDGGNGGNAEAPGGPTSEKAPAVHHSSRRNGPATGVCQFCGRRHPSEECFNKLPAGHRERILQARGGGGGGSRIPWKDRLCVSPDLSAVDKRLNDLYAKIVPRTLRVSQPWLTCDLCGKRIVASVKKLHEEQSCIVRGVQRRLNIIALLVDDEICDNSENVSKLETVIGELGVSPVLRDLPRAVRRAEQIAVLIGVVNAVVNVEDLFPEDEALSVEAVRRKLPKLEQRVDDWAESVRERETNGQKRSGSTVPIIGGSAGRGSGGGSPRSEVESNNVALADSPHRLAVGDVFHAPPLARRVVGEGGGGGGNANHHHNNSVNETATAEGCVSGSGESVPPNSVGAASPSVEASSASRRRHQRATVDELTRPTKRFSARTLRIATKRNKHNGTIDPPSKVLEAAAQRSSSGGSSPHRPSSSRSSSSAQRQRQPVNEPNATNRQPTPVTTSGQSAVTLPPLGPRRSSSAMSNS